MPKISPLGAYTRYASKVATVYASQSAAASGVDQSGALNAALGCTLNSSAGAKRELIIDGWFSVANPIFMGSGSSIRFTPGSGLYCMNGLNGPAIRNANWVSSWNGGSPIYTGSTIVDTNISITGPGTIVGNRGNGTVGNCTSGDPRLSAGNANAGMLANQFVAPLMLFGVNGLVLQDVMVLDPPAFGMHFANIFGMRGHGFSSIDPVTLAGGTPNFSVSRNTDGPHFNGPCDDIILSGLTVSAADDSFALNASDGNYGNGSSPTGSDAIQFGGYASVFTGPITRVQLRGLHLKNSLGGVRLLCGASDINDVLIEGVYGNIYGSALVANTFPLTGTGGKLGTIKFKDWRAIQTGVLNGQFTIGFPTKLFEWEVFCKAATGYTPSLSVNSTINRLDVNVRTDESGTLNQNPVVKCDSGGSVDILDITGGRYRVGQSASTAPFLQVTNSGGATHVNMHDISENNGGGLLSNNGTINDLRVNNCLHYGSSATALVTTSATPPAILTGRGNVGVTKSGTFTASTTFESA